MATEVILTVTESIFSDTTGADVDASIHKYADILEREMENRFNDILFELTIREQSSPVLHSIQVYADDHMTPEQEEDFKRAIGDLEDHILAGDFGEWLVPAAAEA